MSDIFSEFVAESEDNLELFEKKMLALEEDPENKEFINELFRAIHTIKGTAGFFSFSKIEGLGHAGESILGALRDRKLRLSPPIASALLRMNDMLRAILEQIKASGDEGSLEPAALIEELREILAAGLAGRISAPQAAHPVFVLTPIATAPVVPPMTGEEVENSAEFIAAKRADGEIVRVDALLLDGLMDLVGEMVLTRNQMMAAARGVEETQLFQFMQRMSALTSELQEGLTRTRMQPISNVWNKLPRVVRDLSFSCGKQVEVTMKGQDTELDKVVLEAIKDPLTHIVRNAVDHGIESPAVRTSQGKPAHGTLRLKAYHESSKVNITISDDGGGIPIHKIKQKALEKQLITAAEAAKMTDAEALRLIFLPGFSTAEKVTNISGRGVGMDVVRSNIEKIGGTVEIESNVGVGTCFTIKLPLTLAIMPAVLVEVSGLLYAIPQSHVVELLKVPEADSFDDVGGGFIYRFRERLLPLIFLRQFLHLPEVREERGLVVLHSESGQFGLVVERIIDSIEIVVKPLGDQLKKLSFYSGATILGDGRIALVLDTATIAPPQVSASCAKEQEEEETQPSSFLLLQSGLARLAFPMEHISRIERLPVERLEWSEGKEALRYQDSILPLSRISSLLGLPEQPHGEQLNVLVLQKDEAPVGLVVDAILDVVEGDFPLVSQSSLVGLSGSVIIQEKITSMIDVEALLASV